MYDIPDIWSLAEIIDQAKIGEIYEATYAIKEHWWIAKTVDGFIRYVDKDGTAYDTVPLTYSNLRAYYEKIKG